MGKDLAAKKGNSTKPGDRLGTIVRRGERVGEVDFCFGKGIRAPFALCRWSILCQESTLSSASRAELEMCLFLNIGALLWHWTGGKTHVAPVAGISKTIHTSSLASSKRLLGTCHFGVWILLKETAELKGGAEAWVSSPLAWPTDLLPAGGKRDKMLWFLLSHCPWWEQGYEAM